MRRLAALIVGAAVLCAEAPAGVPLVEDDGTELKWDLASAQPNVVGGKVTFFADAATLNDQVSGQSTAIQAIRAGVKEWEIGTTAIRFQEDTSRPAFGVNGLDRVNYIGWADGALDQFVLGATTVTSDAGKITDMDVLLNDSTFAWDTFTPGRAGIADIQSIVTHEWGHACGCDHVPLRTSTMFAITDPGVIALRTIAPDDRALIGSKYMNGAFQTETGSISGVVDDTATSNDRAIHVVAMSVVSGDAESSTLTRADGSYVISGLAPGVYRIVAAPCLPLGKSMNPFWRSGSTSFLPSALRTSAANPAALLPLTVTAGQVTSAPAMTVAPASLPLEPDNSMAQAHELTIGDAVCARFETSADADWYSFTGAAAQKVTIAVHSWGLGSSADPAIDVLDASGMPVTQQEDTRSPSAYVGQIEGQDLDVRIVGFSLPSSGQYFLKLRDQRPNPGANGFYVLMLTPSSDAPSTALTVVTATPKRLDADGVSTSLLVVRPKRETGDDVGPGATVEWTHTGLALASAVTDKGDGTYEATVTAPATPGSDRFSAVVTTPEGKATLLDAVTLVYVGPVDLAKSTFTATPRRIDSDGVSQADVLLVPRDVNGEDLGPGRDAAFTMITSSGATIGSHTDVGDGSYTAKVTAPAVHGDAGIGAAVDGVSVGAGFPRQVWFGFDLQEVFTAAKADVPAIVAIPGLRSKARGSYAKALAVITRALDELQDGGSTARPHAVRDAVTVLSKITAGRKQARMTLPQPGTERELARAVREAAAADIAASVVDNGKEQRTLDAANALIASGDAAFAADKLLTAAVRWRKAFSKVRRLQP